MNSINCKCLSVQQQYEFEAPPGLIYPQAILFDDINDDGVSNFNCHYLTSFTLN
jgi:hypothetical protein